MFGMGRSADEGAATPRWSLAVLLVTAKELARSSGLRKP
jgi:hypothetical protein